MPAARRRPAAKKPAAAPKKPARRKRSPAAPASSSMVKAVRQDLRVLRRSAPGVGDASLEALALSLARELDNTKTSATSKSMCARALLDTLERLRSLSAEEETDGLDDLSARRAARRRAAP